MSSVSRIAVIAAVPMNIRNIYTPEAFLVSLKDVKIAKNAINPSMNIKSC